MTAWKGRHLLWYLDPPLVGITEINSGAAGWLYVCGRNSATVQADDRVWRPRDVVGGTTMLAAHPMTADWGPVGCFCICCFLPASLTLSRLFAYEQASFRKAVWVSVLSFRVMLSVLEGRDASWTKPLTVRNTFKPWALAFCLIPVKNLEYGALTLEKWKDLAAFDSYFWMATACLKEGAAVSFRWDLSPLVHGPCCIVLADFTHW